MDLPAFHIAEIVNSDILVVWLHSCAKATETHALSPMCVRLVAVCYCVIPPYTHSEWISSFHIETRPRYSHMLRFKSILLLGLLTQLFQFSTIVFHVSWSFVIIGHLLLTSQLLFHFERVCFVHLQVCYIYQDRGAIFIIFLWKYMQLARMLKCSEIWVFFICDNLTSRMW